MENIQEIFFEQFKALTKEACQRSLRLHATSQQLVACAPKTIGFWGSKQW
jgi:hypothetical protein